MGNTGGRQPAKGLELRKCVTCKAEFQPYRDNQTTCSRSCRDRQPQAVAKARAYRQRVEVTERKNAARRVGNNPDRRAYNLRQAIKRYGVTYDEYLAMVEAQGNRCAICGRTPDPNGIKAASRLHVDHDHLTGKVRQLLCGRCNQGVGFFGDDPARLRTAAEYIERHREE